MGNPTNDKRYEGDDLAPDAQPLSGIIIACEQALYAMDDAALSRDFNEDVASIVAVFAEVHSRIEPIGEGLFADQAREVISRGPVVVKVMQCLFYTGIDHNTTSVH